MNLILLEESDRVNGPLFRLSGDRARHVVEVIRAEPGRALRVGLLEGPRGSAVVRSVEEGPAVLLDCAFEEAPPPRALTDLVLAIPRPKSLARLLPEAAALGVDRITLVRTWRVAKPYVTATILEPAEHVPLLKEGLMQAKDTRLPRLEVEPLFKPWVEDRAPGAIAGARAFVAHPEAARDLASERLGPEERAAIAIGPEGGFTLYEVGALAKAGFIPVSLGTRVLRVETAVTAALTTLSVLRRQTG